MINILFLLIVGHAVADYGLQTRHIAENKSPYRSPQWFYPLMAHSLIHGGMVFLVTGSTGLGMLETIFHFIIDIFRSTNKISKREDQALHIFCKIIYVAFIMAVI